MPTATMKKATKEGRNKVYTPFLECVVNGDNVPIEVLKKNHNQLIDSRDQLIFTIENLSSMERSEELKLKKQLSDIELMLAALKPRKHNYPIFSQLPLTWRDKNGYPTLVLMALDGEGFVEMRAYNETHDEKKARCEYNPIRGDERFKEIYDKVLNWQYGDVGELLRNKCPTRGEVSIRTLLSGLLIPDKTREKIAVAKLYFSDQIFMITEVKEWTENETVYPDPDPIIVGFEDGHLFYVDSFDLTPTEEVAVREFTITQAS